MRKLTKETGSVITARTTSPNHWKNNKNKSMLKGMQKKHARADFSRSRGLCSVWASFSDRTLNLNILIAVSRNSLSLLPQLSS